MDGHRSTPGHRSRSGDDADTRQSPSPAGTGDLGGLGAAGQFVAPQHGGPSLFASHQARGGSVPQSRPITLQELEQLSRAGTHGQGGVQGGVQGQFLSSQFAGNSLFLGGEAGHHAPQMHPEMGAGVCNERAIPGFVYQQQHGGSAQTQEPRSSRSSLFGDSFFQGVAGHVPGAGMQSPERIITQTMDARVGTMPPGFSSTSSTSAASAPGMDQLTTLFSQQTVRSGGDDASGTVINMPGAKQTTIPPLPVSNFVLPSPYTETTRGKTVTVMHARFFMENPDLWRCLHIDYYGSIGLVAGLYVDWVDGAMRAMKAPGITLSPGGRDQGLESPSPVQNLSFPALHVEASRTPDAREPNDDSVSTPTSTTHFQKQSREDRWVDIMDHTHTGRKPVTNMARLNKSLLSLAKSLAPDDDDVAAWRQALAYVQEILKTTLGSKLKDVNLFGSSANGLAVRGNNDIDVSAMVELGGNDDVRSGDIFQETEIEAREAAVHQKKADIIEELGLALQKDLEKRFGKASAETQTSFNLLVLPNARVPVIKFTYPPTSTQVDITINNTLACLNTKLIACYAAIDPRLTQLVHIVKHWAKRRHVNDPYTGTLSSYCYVLMCIFHCQTRNPPILPNLQDETTYPMTIDTVVDSWKVAYLDDVETARRAFTSSNTQTLASLVWEFFEFWAWKHSYPHDVISIRNARIISKSSKDWTKRIGRDRHLVCIEDPFVLSHDLGRTVDMRSKDVIRKEFFRAGTVLRDYETCFELLFEAYDSEARRARKSRLDHGRRRPK